MEEVEMTFAPHLSEISIHRTEPPQHFDVEAESRIIAERNATLAERIVTESWLKRPKDDKRIKAQEEKIRQLIEFDERMAPLKKFMVLWNRWRHLYYDLPPIWPKTKGQITSIENSIDFAKEKEMSLEMLIAVVHRAHLKRKFMPGYSSLITHGDELYKKYHDNVVADLDRWEYQSRSLG